MIWWILIWGIDVDITLTDHCPSADNPRTLADETDCSNKLAKDSIYRGESGNICQVDCANLGICNYNSGQCNCFDGQYGVDCSISDPTAIYDAWNK